jgi:uncharacterized protein (DUF433 family)
MKMHQELRLKGKKLLALLVSEIKRGRFKPRQPETFISYSEVLEKLGIPKRGLAGHQLQREGLRELEEWTSKTASVPKIDALIIDKRKKRPGPGYAPSHGHSEADWEKWWLDETARAIAFEHWDAFVGEEAFSYPATSATADALREGPDGVDYRKIITVEPGKRGGKPCIRGMRITVSDVLGWLASGMSHDQIRSDFPEVTEADIRACLAFAAEKERHAVSIA